ncbi:MAG: ComF family protein [Dyella sp.]|nr:ComF family protein [Dyella sp.]
MARCPRCATPGALPGHCDACANDDPIDATLTLGDYIDPFDQLVLRLKFAARLPAAGWIATQLAARMQASGCVPDLLTPIPLAPRRLGARGFNQAWEIARPLARQLGVAASPTLLARRRDTASQRALDHSARQANLQDAFALAQPRRLDGLHIGLVDDVMTTGATLREAARVLKAHGAARITALPALRTP